MFIVIKCGGVLMSPRMGTCVCDVYLCVHEGVSERVCLSCCQLCNSSKHQGSTLLCRINKSLASIATRHL